MSQRARSTLIEQTITGYIVPNDENDDVENEDEEEEVQTEYLDMKEVNSVSSGGKVFKFSFPVSKEGILTFLSFSHSSQVLAAPSKVILSKHLRCKIHNLLFLDLLNPEINFGRKCFGG